MPFDPSRYPKNWSEISHSVKEAANWCCSSCGRQCFRPSDKKPKGITRSQWTAYTLCVHHYNYDPSDNRLDKLIPLCTACHLAKHTRRRGNITPGQLSLW
ncbi:MAG: HNH endonuclease [Prochloraceae cyanobacterium]